MKKFLVNNLLMKIFALVLALIVWSAVRMQISKGAPTWSSRMITTTTFTQIPINIMQEPSDNNSYELIPPSATVSISGSRLNVNATKPEMITLFVTVTPEEAEEAPLTQNTNKGVMNKKIQAKIPTEVTLGTIEPSTVRLITKKGVKTNSISGNNVLPNSNAAFSPEDSVGTKNDSASTKTEIATSPTLNTNLANAEK
jgi:YbbR domain-containing protein